MNTVVPKNLIFSDLGVILREADPDRKQWYLRPWSSAESPIVICGCGRSGTTLLRSMIDSHPNLYCGPESRLLLPLFNTQTKQTHLLGHYFDLPQQWVQDAWDTSSSQGEFVDRFFAQAATAAGKQRWAEKTPRNIVAIGWVLERWPNAHIVHVVRDGRDVVCSLRTHPKWEWNIEQHKRVPRKTLQPFGYCVERWFVETSVALQWRGHPAYHEVKYEDLVNNTTTTLQRLCKQLGEQWSTTMLDYHTKQRSDYKFTQNDGIDKPVYANSIGRWRQDLTTQEIVYFKRRANTLLQLLGYVSGSSWR